MFELSELEEDPSYPLANIQEALSHLSAPLSTWLEEQEANFNSLQPAQLVREVATKATEQEDSLERRKRSLVEESDLQLQALCEVSERVFRPRAARRSVNLNDTQVIWRQNELT